MSVYSETADGYEAGAAAAKTSERPDFITDEHLEYLDDLRESGVTNMFGARPYVKRKFRKLTDEQSAAVLSYWMKTFGDDNR